MKIFRRALPLLFLSAGSIASMALSSGTPAPDFSLPDTGGKTHSLSEYKGKFVVLEWTNPECPFVRKHYESGNMPSLQKAYRAKGVVWLTIDSSAPGKPGNMAPDELAKWDKKQGAGPTAVLLDPAGRVGRAYGAKATPDMYVINPDGKLVYEGAIDSIASPDKSDIAKATNYVKSALEESMTGKAVSTPETRAYGCSVKY